MKTAMIWGATGGIGRALVEGAPAEDWGLITVSRNDQGLGRKVALALEADFSRPVEVERAVLAASQEVASVEVLLYAAGDIQSFSIAEQSGEDWDRIIESNLGAVVRVVRSCLPLLSEDASIVVIGAISERLRLPGLSAYATSKAGLEAWMEVLRKEQRKKKVLLVRPSAVKTAFWEKVPFNLPDGAQSAEQISARIWEAIFSGETGVLDIA